MAEYLPGKKTLKNKNLSQKILKGLPTLRVSNPFNYYSFMFIAAIKLIPAIGK